MGAQNDSLWVSAFPHLKIEMWGTHFCAELENREADLRLSLEEIDGLGEVGDADVLGEGGVLALEGQEHLPGDAAIAEVAGGAGAEFDDVLGFGEVHLEEAAAAGG
jgi:hypothetical protein